MERDNDTSFDSTAAQGASTGGNMGGSIGSTSGSTGASGTTASDSGSMMDRARDIAGSAQDKLADVGSTVREKTSTAKDSIADALESGADKLRQRMGSGQTAGATGAGSIAIDDGRAAQISNRLASGMDATADWLRDADLDSLRSAVERQVREHPGRTLLVAAGVGYLIGKAFKSNS